MSRFSGSNRQIGRDQDGYPSRSVNFFSLADWSCLGNSVNEDFVHPSFAVQSPKFKSDPQKSSKHDIHHCSSGNVRSQTQSESTEDEDSSKAKETLPGGDSHSSNHQSKHITSFFCKIPFKGYSDGFDNRSSVVHSRVGRAASSSKSGGHSQASSSKVKDSVLCCDKCDARHETEDCPYYKKKREIHLDGQKNGWKLVGGSSNLPGAVLRIARVVAQAGDGSCLFHSMSFGIKDGSNARTLRGEISAYIQHHPQTTICETPLSEWVKWDSGISCTEYARKMKNGAWGGGIEMACMSALKACNVHVYKSLKLGGFKRISAFDHPVNPELKKTIRVLYRGGVHYDALVKIV